MTQDEFDALLAWLNPERGMAGQRYEEIRRRIVKILVCRGCPVSEDLADEAIDRVGHKVGEIAPTYRGDPILYFYGVANNVHKEWLRKERPAVPMPVLRAHDPPSDPLGESDEPEYQCLEECMDRLKSEERTLVLQYYEGEGQGKIDHRKRLADGLGIGLNTLRIRVFRIRSGLQECVELCMKQPSAQQ